MKEVNGKPVGTLCSAGGAILVCLAAACTPVPLTRPAPAPAPATVVTPLIVTDLPTVPVQTLATDSAAASASKRDKGQRITLNSANADLRDLLPLLASAAGVNLVMGPEVHGNVSVRFQNVRAIDALNAVIEQAGLVVGDPAVEAPWAAPVFYDLPVNINQASASTMRVRFDITQRLADWIVKGRTF